MHSWKKTNSEEMKKFLGLILWMGFVKTNPISNYWSKNPLYNFVLPRNIMSRNKFKLLLSNFHFADKISTAPEDRLKKILPLVNKLQKKYQETFRPGEDIVIDETFIPRRGGFIFKQYIPNKAHKYGIKLFKLYSSEGYTWSMKIYSDTLFHKGRTLYIDNFYTSYELAISCLNRKTHVVGTLKNNKKFMPEDILNCKLKKGEIVSKEDNNGIVILKWRDSREVRILSTKHAPIMVPSNIHAASTIQHSSEKLKPLAVLAYNKRKCRIDYSDQMVSYVSTMRKRLKWYQKLGIQLLLGITVVNASIIYKIATKKNINIRKFREILALKLLGLTDNIDKFKVQSDCQCNHNIAIRKNALGQKIKRACKLCYSNKRLTTDRSKARINIKRTTTFCPDCPDKPQLCIDVFKAFHCK
ncbi:PREDICTED: piggyBac transposable element-derived protein 4-like [Polistes dominula]|uniref:PiggyBac transposable element-derived protein 4-like n=1 Tax=Polistes dominula TaxID=743375 RepID=A0ABM1IBN6_POLDO|nr:PREDICTED: piggyBac transposable element-derived protein 4-like [Polistes dominula]